MKRRKKVWVVLGQGSELIGIRIHVYLHKVDAIEMADPNGYYGNPTSVVPATLEYDIPAKENKP